MRARWSPRTGKACTPISKVAPMARSNPDVCRRSMRPSRRGALPAALLVFAGLAGLAQGEEAVLRVCADPSNLPLSNQKGEGYENKIAEALARDLKRRV